MMLRHEIYPRAIEIDPRDFERQGRITTVLWMWKSRWQSDRWGSVLYHLATSPTKSRKSVAKYYADLQQLRAYRDAQHTRLGIGIHSWSTSTGKPSLLICQRRNNPNPWPMRQPSRQIERLSIKVEQYAQFMVSEDR